jgi:SAM-dependent methyltransferase
MKLLHTHYLPRADEITGRAASLIEIEEPREYDTLYEYIVESGYYGSEYFDRDIGYRDKQIVSHFFWVAEIVRHLRPHRVLEVGCGRGDVLHLLDRARVDVTGVDVSPYVVDASWPSLQGRIHCGDFRDVLAGLAAAGERFDVVCGFDIWEHLPPDQLDAYLEAAVSVASPDAMFYFVVPAFGADAVFGEQFPLEFEENRADFDARRPFRHLLSDAYKGGVPTLGHLIWAHTEWWQAAFERHGLVRVPDVEVQVHHFLDPLVPHSVRAFYLFTRDTPQGRARADALIARPYDRGRFTRSVTHLLTGFWWGPGGRVRFDSDLRRTALRAWRSRLAALRTAWTGVLRRRLPGPRIR